MSGDYYYDSTVSVYREAYKIWGEHIDRGYCPIQGFALTHLPVKQYNQLDKVFDGHAPTYGHIKKIFPEFLKGTGLTPELHDMLVILENVGIGTPLYYSCISYYIDRDNYNMMCAFDWTEHIIFTEICGLDPNKSQIFESISGTTYNKYITGMSHIAVGDMCTHKSNGKVASYFDMYIRYKTQKI